MTTVQVMLELFPVERLGTICDVGEESRALEARERLSPGGS